MNRSALLLYLKNILDLEMLLDRTKKTHYENETRYYSMLNALKKKWADKLHWKEPMPPKEPETGIGCLPGVLIFILVGVLCTFYGVIDRGIEQDEYAVLTIMTVVTVVDLIILFFVIKGYRDENADYYYEYREYRRLMSQKQARLKLVEKNRQAYEAELKDLNARWEEYERMYDRELSKVKALLQEAYDIRVLPNPYRNLASVYYIYDYMSSSNASLEDTLMHEHMENGIQRIMAGIDNVIANQETMMIESRRREADNRVQNQKLLNSLNRIEANSSESIYQTSLAANYSKTSAFFSEATFWYNVFK